MHEEARTAWQILGEGFPCCPECVTFLKQAPAGLRSPFPHCLFPAASTPRAKMGWGGGARYRNLFPPALTEYRWVLSTSRGYSEARVWPGRGMELPAALGCPQIRVQHLEQLAGLRQGSAPLQSISGSADSPSFRSLLPLIVPLRSYR